MTLAWHPIAPFWMIAVAALLLAAALADGLRVLVAKNLPRRWIITLALLRSLAIVIFLLVLARPELTREKSVNRRPELIVLVDTSQSMGQRDMPGNATRLEHLLAALRKGPFAEQWLSRFQARVFAFDASARLLATGAPKELQPEGETTMLAESMTAAWSIHRQRISQAGVSGAEAARMLLLSDGLDRSALDAAEIARRLGPAVDVLALPRSDAMAKSELVIAGVQAPNRVTLGAEARIMVSARHSGTAELHFTVSLLEDGRQILEQPMTLPANQSEIQGRMAFRPTSLGLKSYTLRLSLREPVPGLAPGPPVSISIPVNSRQTETLLLENAWRWEFPFLRRILENDPQFAMTAFLERGRGIYMQFGESDRHVTLAGFPQTRAELAGFDIFLFGDVNPATWSPALPAAINELVMEEGKSLIILAGPRIGRLASNPSLAPLLPVEFGPAAGRPLEGPIPIRLAADAQESPLFFAPPDAPERWKNLPELERIFPPVRKKPAATVLVEAIDHANEYGRLIVVAEQTVGRGRVLIICSDTLWKWQLAAAADPAGNTPYTFFWQQALRAMQPARLSFGNIQIWLQPDRTQAKTGQRVKLALEIDSDRPITRPIIEANLTLPDDSHIPLAFTPLPSDPMRFESSFIPRQPGRHLIASALLADGKTLADQNAAVDVLAMPPETEPLPPDHDFLGHLAKTTGGMVINPAEPSTWPTIPTDHTITTLETRKTSLWDNFTLILTLTALLGLDWFIRLVRGYS